MRELGNLAIVCAQRDDLRLVIGKQPDRGNVYLAQWAEGEAFLNAIGYFSWDDDETIRSIIYELNFGRYRKEDTE